MKADKAPQPSPEDQNTLANLANLLQIFHHRNKNQHRRSSWWRHFSVFRRQLDTLTREYQSLNEVPATNLARVQKKKRDAQTEQRIQQRLTFWKDNLVNKWHHAFSQLVADARFAVMGLVLLAVLAQVCRVLGITAEIEENIGPEESERILRNYRQDEYDVLSDGFVATNETHGFGEDFGEIVPRAPLPEDHLPGDASKTEERTINNKPYVPAVEEEKSRQSTATMTKKNTKKRKKSGNVIDDMFSGLE